MLFVSSRASGWAGMLILTAALLVGLAFSPAGAAEEPDKFTDEFRLGDCQWSSTGRNTYFVLEPKYQLVYEGRENGKKVGLTVTVLDQTKQVNGVQTRIVKEEHTEDGKLIELSMNWFAICKQTNSVFYFGEKVDNIENGQVVNHDGSWEAGKNGAKPGLIMPGLPLLGARYFQELAPGAAQDRAEIESLTATVRTPAGTFNGCLKTEETTPLEPNVEDIKFYAPTIGLVQDGPLKLVKYGFLP